MVFLTKKEKLGAPAGLCPGSDRLADLQGGSTLLKPLYWEIISTCQCLRLPWRHIRSCNSGSHCRSSRRAFRVLLPSIRAVKIGNYCSEKTEKPVRFCSFKKSAEIGPKTFRGSPSSQKKPFSEIGTEIVRSFCHSATNKEILRSETH